MQRFNARFFHHKAEATDAFAQNWAGELNWVVSPIFLLNRAIEHCKNCRAEMILICPKWKSGVFWPKVNELIKDKKHVMNILTMRDIFEHGSASDSIFAKANWKGESLALHVRF